MMRWARVALIGAYMITGAASAQSCGQMQDLGEVEGLAVFPYLISADGEIIVGAWYDNEWGDIRSFYRTLAGDWLEVAIPGYPLVRVADLSADGSVMVGLATNPHNWDQRGFRWSASQGAQFLDGLGGFAHAPEIVSRDGTVVIGTFRVQDGTEVRQRAFRWTQGGGMASLGVLPGGYVSNAMDASFDGSVVVGLADDSDGSVTAFRWTESDGMQAFPGPEPSSVAAVSGDGATMLGRFEPSGIPFRWTDAAGIQYFDFPPATSQWSAGIASGDGGAVLGGYLQSGQWVMARWTLNDGFVPLGSLPPPYDRMTGIAWSDDLTVVVGYGGLWPLRQGFRWTLAGGISDLGTLGGTYTEPLGMSADGLRVIGQGINADGIWQGFVIDYRECVDSDADGLPDDWEVNGIPYEDSAGVMQRYPLPGANPMRKDLYLEIDAMEGVSLHPDTKNHVRDAFRDAPVTNPDGSSGIELHIVEDDSEVPLVYELPLEIIGDDGGVFPSSFDAIRAAWFGTADEQTPPDQAAVLEAKALAYRYCLLAFDHWPLPDGFTLGGHVKYIGHDNMVLYASNMGSAVGAADESVVEAAVLMHELGHSLGLGHGGCDNDQQGQSNQPSIMNYVFMKPFEWNARFWRLDYLRVGPEELGDLNELALDENAGIGSTNGYYRDVWMPYGVDETVGEFSSQRTVAYARLDGSPVDFGSAGVLSQQDGLFEPGIVQDLNYIATITGGGVPDVPLPTRQSPGETHRVCNEWEALVLPTRALRLTQRGSRDDEPLVSPREPTIADLQWIDENLPPPPSLCLADVNGDGSLNFFDVQQYLNWYAAVDARADFVEDGSLNFFDVQLFLNLYAAGCP